MVIKANKHADGIGGHLVHLRQLGQPLRGRLQPLLPGQGRRPARRPHLLPGPRRARHLRPGLPRGPARPRTTSTTSAGRSAATGLQLLPPPAADAGLLGVPDGLDGPRPDHRHLPRPLQPLPPQPPPRRHQPGPAVWCFVGDGECDEPETLGALSLASRERLDNLIFVVNCNLQRLDGPVRGNGKIIQELEATFRGAGWNVIKVIWGSKWDELLRQGQGRRAAQQDEHHRRRRVPALLGGVRAPTSASTSSGPIPACASWSSTCPTTSCAGCPAAATTTASSTPPTRRPPTTSAAARRPPSWPRRSRAGRSAPRSRAATPPTRSRR